jgi:hypothetical protein
MSSYCIITQVSAQIYLQHTSCCNETESSEKKITVGQFTLETVSWEQIKWPKILYFTIVLDMRPDFHQ